MAERFHKGQSTFKRATQIWQVLVCQAAHRQTMTYGQLSEVLGFGGAGVLGKFLEPVWRYCEAHDLPTLTVLVVNQETGLPGGGLSLEDLHRERERVFHLNWHEIVPPTEADIEAAMDMRGRLEGV